MLLGGALNAYTNYEAGQSQADQSRANAGQISGLVQNQMGQNQQSLDYYGRNLQAGYNQAGSILGSSGSAALGSLAGGYGQAQNQLQQGYGNAESQLSPLTSAAKYANIAAGQQLGAGYQQSPGMQFQLQQGQQALDRAQAASGGRYSGAAMKAGMQFSQGLANQDYQQYVQNQLAQGGQQLQAAGLGYGAAAQLGNLFAGQGQQGAALSAQQGQNTAALQGNIGSALAGNQIGAATSMANYNMAGQSQQNSLLGLQTSAIAGQSAAPSLAGSVAGGAGNVIGQAGAIGLGYVSSGGGNGAGGGGGGRTYYTDEQLGY